jgi:hypothetical protein
MNEIQTTTGRPPTEGEQALSDWFEKQSLFSLDTIEAAARTILGLVTALVGALFGVLTVAAKDLPAYLQFPVVRVLGAASVTALLVALLGAVLVLLPQRIRYSSHRLDEQAQAFQDLLKHKARWLTVTVIAFAVGVDTLGVVLIIALLTA